MGPFESFGCVGSSEQAKAKDCFDILRGGTWNADFALIQTGHLRKIFCTLIYQLQQRSFFMTSDMISMKPNHYKYVFPEHYQRRVRTGCA